MPQPPPDAPCRHCQSCKDLGFAELLKDLPDTLVAALNSQKTVLHLKKGELLYDQGDSPRGMYCISSGQLKLYATHPGGKVTILELVKAGQFLGLPDSIADRPWQHSAEMITAGVVCQLPAGVVQQCLSESAQFSLNLANSLAHRLRRNEQRLIALSSLPVPARVAGLLVSLWNPLQPYAPVVPLSRAELAQLVGSTVESVSRILHRLQRAGAVKLKGRAILMESPELLKTFAQDLDNVL